MSVYGVTDTPGIELDLTAEQRALRASVREYVRGVVVPARGRLDAVRTPADFPWDIVEPGCELGLRLLPLPEEHGGIDADTTTLVLVAEELAAGDLGIAYYFKHNWRFAKLFPRLPGELAQWVLSELRHNPRFLPASATTEHAAGSDNNLPYEAPEAGLALRADRDGAEWVLNGSKFMITNGGMASLYLVGGRTDPSVPVSKGTTIFAVRADTPGISYGAPYTKIGQRASLQCDVVFDNVRVPLDHAIGKVGEGLEATRRALIGANVINAAMAVGIARAAYEEALQWSIERVQGGVPIYQHQLVARDLGAMRADWEAARCYTWATARAFARLGPELAELASGANLFATEAVVRVARAAMELFGGRGMMGEWPVEKLVRDAMTLQHANGTNGLVSVKMGRRDAETLVATSPGGG
jgi:alkylation response protein AidB-like acyl-CoA dehydrogenase